MQHFLLDENIIPRDPPIISDADRLVVVPLEDEPTYTHVVDVSMITFKARPTYKKETLFAILETIFGTKTLPGGQKLDVVKFLLKPENLEKILYNNELVARKAARERDAGTTPQRPP